MRFHSQNLNENHLGQPKGSKFWRGRAWLYGSREHYDELLHWEWHFGKYARDFAITATVGCGDSDAGVCFHVCIPWLFSLFLVFPYVYRCGEYKTGIAIHNGAFWIHPFTDEHESRSDDPWWEKAYAFNFPWTYKHHLTEVLRPAFGVDSADWPSVWDDKGKDFLGTFDERKAAEKSVSLTYDYTYTLKRGEVQKVKATVFVSRMTWRMRWWPLLPFKKVRTSIDVAFDQEVGEGSGSWKGGVVGTGYEMLPGEMPLETLRRMEKEVKFSR